MSHFYASIDKAMLKGNVTARGSKGQGIEAHIRGWDIGVRIETLHIAGFDIIKIYETKGSNSPENHRLIEQIKLKTNRNIKKRKAKIC